MSCLAIVGGASVGGRALTDADVLIEGRHISAIGPTATAGAATTSVLDATGCHVLAGFIDLQVNGALGVDLTTEPQRLGEVAAFLPQCGVTSFMPTVISAPLTGIAAAVATLAGWERTAADARSLGVHVEGPFLAPSRCGAHPPEHLRLPSIEAVATWRPSEGVALVTLAPELPHALEVIRELGVRGVIVNIGHTDADPATIAAAIGAGARGATHLFNAMGGLSARSPGPAGAVLADDSLIAGLIVDGIHVSPEMVRLAWRALGADRIALVSDAMAALGLPDGTYRIGDTPVTVGPSGARTATGVLAGSVLRFDQSVRNLVEITGCTLADAASAASTTPARLAGRDDLGRLAVGCLADVVLLDHDLRVVATIVDGRVVWDPHRRERSN